MLPLAFRFDTDAVLIGEMAHRAARERLPVPLPGDAISVLADDVYLAERCPRECPRCRPGFETMLSYQFESTTPTATG